MGLADTAKLVVDLSLGGNFRTGIAGATRDLKNFDGQVSQTSSRSFRAGQQIGTGIKNIAKIGLASVTAGAGIVAASLKVAGDFEAQLNTINTIAHDTPTQLKAIGDQLRTISKNTGLALEDLTQSYYDLLSAGVKTADAQAVLNDAVTLGIGGLATTAQAVDLLTTAYNAYGLNAAGAAKATDQFALAVQDGKVTADQIAASFANVAPLAKTYKIGIDQITASYATLTAQGVPAAEVTTEMQRAIISLISPSAKLAAAGKALHVDFTKEIAKKGLVGTLQEIRLYSDKTGIPLQDLLGRVEAVKYALATTGPNFAGFNAELAKMGKASGTAAAQMAERQKGLNFQIARLKALAKDAGITIGSALLPKLTPLVAKLNELIQGHQADIAKFGDSLAGLFTKANIDKGAAALTDLFNTVKSVAPSLLAAAEITGKVIQTAVNAFKSLPPELQQLAIVGLTVNKLTGGLVTNVAGGIVGAILGQLKSAIVNVSGAVVNVNGVSGVAGAAGKAGGGLAALASSAVALLGVGAVEIAIAGVAGAWLKANVPGWGTAQGAAQVGPVVIGGQSQSQAARAAADAAKLGTTAHPLVATLLDRGGREKGFNALAGKLKDDRVSLGQLLKANAAKIASDQLEAMRSIWSPISRALGTLGHTNDPKKIAAAVKELEQTFVKEGHGNLANTRTAVKELEAQLKNTHDPTMQSALRHAIADLKAKIPGREYAQRQIDRANKIIHSTQSTADKIKALQAIENDLKNHKLPGAASSIQKKIDAQKVAAVAAAKATTQAVKDKDLSVSVTVPITNRTIVNTRNLITTVHTLTNFYSLGSGVHGLSKP